MRRSLFAGCLLIAASALLASCERNEEDEEAEDMANLGRLAEAVLEAAGEAECSDSTECRFVPLGSKPCGGPWAYLIFSTAADTVTLLDRVAGYNAFQDELNRKWGWISDCMVPNQPRLGCVDGRCVDLNTN